MDLAKRNAKQRIDLLVEDSEVLRERVKERRSRDSGNTVLSKEFPDGVLILTGASGHKARHHHSLLGLPGLHTSCALQLAPAVPK